MCLIIPPIPAADNNEAAYYRIACFDDIGENQDTYVIDGVCRPLECGRSCWCPGKVPP